MSKNTQIIEVSPPDYDWRHESVVMRGFQCPQCNGGGFVMEYDVRESYKIACPRCSGTGRLRAKTTIEWEADE